MVTAHPDESEVLGAAGAQQIFSPHALQPGLSALPVQLAPLVFVPLGRNCRQAVEALPVPVGAVEAAVDPAVVDHVSSRSSSGGGEANSSAARVTSPLRNRTGTPRVHYR